MAPPTKCTKQQGRLGLSRDHVTSHLNTSQPLAPWNSLPTKNFGKFQKHLSSIMQPIPVHPFLFPAVFDCCEHPFLSVPLENTLDNRPPDTTVVLGSLLSLVSANSNSHGPQQPQSTAVYVRLPLSTSESFPPQSIGFRAAVSGVAVCPVCPDADEPGGLAAVSVSVGLLLQRLLHVAESSESLKPSGNAANMHHLGQKHSTDSAVATNSVPGTASAGANHTQCLNTAFCHVVTEGT